MIFSKESLSTWKNYTGSLWGILLVYDSCWDPFFKHHWWLVSRICILNIWGNIVQVIVSFFSRHLHDLYRRKLVLSIWGFVHEIPYISIWLIYSHIGQLVIGVILYWRRYYIIFKTVAKRIPILIFQLVVEFKGVIPRV